MKKFLIFGIIALRVMPLFSTSLEDLTGAERAAMLRGSADPLTEVQLKKPVPVLLPEHDNIKQLFTDIQNRLQPSVMVETLFLYSKPQNAVQADKWSEAQRLALYNQTLGISTLAGIKYYSASRNAMRTFYETSSLIDGPNTKKPLPDPVFSAIPQSLSIHARQKDLTFGDNIYRYDYYSYPDALIFVQENITAMNVGIIMALGKNKLRSFLAVYDAGDSLLIYAASMAKAASLPGMDERIGSSFTNRAEAILGWFIDRVESQCIFIKPYF